MTILEKIKNVAAVIFIIWFTWFGIMVGLKLMEKADQELARQEHNK